MNLDLYRHIEIPAAARPVFTERTNPQLALGKPVAIPEAEFFPGKVDLPSLVFGISTLERYPAQRLFGRFGVGDTPVQPVLFELLAPRGVLDTHPLHRAAAHAHAVNPAVNFCRSQPEMYWGLPWKGPLPWPR